MTMMHCSRFVPTLKFSLLLASGIVAILPFAATSAQAQQTPSLIVTSEPVPESLKNNIYQTIGETRSPIPAAIRSDVYSKPVEIRSITPQEVAGSSYYSDSSADTIVSGKVDSLEGDLGSLQNRIASLSTQLSGLQRENEDRAATYFANIATINTQLQSGTTPGNPRLVKRLGTAERNLEDLGSSVASLNGMSVDIANTASEASFLLDATRAAYRISGAVEEDHVRLSELEDSINNTIIMIERVLNTSNDEITRTTTYLASERNNLRTLALGVTNGDLYGKSLANRPFSSAGQFQLASTGSDNAGFENAAPTILSSAAPAPSSPALSGPRLLAKVKFDRPDVDYEQPVFVAVNDALARYPDARFDLVAVNPTGGNAAEVAIETTRARRNAEKVLRTLTQMGLSPEIVDVSHNASSSAKSNEVHLYVK